MKTSIELWHLFRESKLTLREFARAVGKDYANLQQTFIRKFPTDYDRVMKEKADRAKELVNEKLNEQRAAARQVYKKQLPRTLFIEDISSELRAEIISQFKDYKAVSTLAKEYKVNTDGLVKALRNWLTDEVYEEIRAEILRRHYQRIGQRLAATRKIYRPGVMDNKKRKGPGSRHRHHRGRKPL